MAAVPMVREKLDDSKNEMPHQANPSGYPEKLVYEGIRFTTDPILFVESNTRTKNAQVWLGQCTTGQLGGAVWLETGCR